MRLTTKTRYGTRAMVDLALHYDEGPVSSRAIAAHQDISAKYLESILAELRNAGLVLTVRGAQGGHSLRRPPSEITLLDIFEVLEGTQGLVECTNSAEVCTRRDSCVTQEVWAEMYAACLGILESTMLDDLARRARDKREPTTDMYYI